MASEAFIALLALLSSFFSLFFRKPRRRRLPPGPKPWPLLGNVTDLRPKELWLLATDWAKRYGPSLSVFLRLSLSELQIRPRRCRILAPLWPRSHFLKLACCSHRTHGKTERNIF